MDDGSEDHPAEHVPKYVRDHREPDPDHQRSDPWLLRFAPNREDQCGTLHTTPQGVAHEGALKPNDHRREVNLAVFKESFQAVERRIAHRLGDVESGPDRQPDQQRRAGALDLQEPNSQIDRRQFGEFFDAGIEDEIDDFNPGSNRQIADDVERRRGADEEDDEQISDFHRLGVVELVDEKNEGHGNKRSHHHRQPREGIGSQARDAGEQDGRQHEHAKQDLLPDGGKGDFERLDGFGVLLALKDPVEESFEIQGTRIRIAG